jgi:hypothetical protein
MEEIEKFEAPEEGFDYNITCEDVSVIQFDWLKEDLVDKSVSEFQFSTTSDVEYVEENLYRFHLDFRIELDRFFYIHLRTIFKMEIAEENVFRFHPQKDMVMMTYDYIKDAVGQYHEDEGKKFNLENFDQIPMDFWDDYIRKLYRPMLNFGIQGDGDPKDLFKTYYTFQQDYASALLVRGTILIMDEIFFNNPSFNRKQNQLRLEQIIPPNFYLTMRAELNKLNKEPVGINFKQFIFLIVAVECVCHILTTDHLDYMEARLDGMNFGEHYRKEYIQVAEPFARDSKANIKKGGMTIGNWEINYDWDKLIT